MRRVEIASRRSSRRTWLRRSRRPHSPSPTPTSRTTSTRSSAWPCSTTPTASSSGAAAARSSAPPSSSPPGTAPTRPTVRRFGARLLPAGRRRELRSGHAARPCSGYPEYCAAGTFGTLCATSAELYNYGFANLRFPNTHDVGLVILDQPIAIAGVRPASGSRRARQSAHARGTKRHGLHRQRVRPFLSHAGALHSAVPNISFRERLMATVDAGEPQQRPERRLQPADAGQRRRPRRDVLRRLRRPGLSRRPGVQPDRRGHVVRPQLPLPRHGLRIPHRPAGGARLDQRSRTRTRAGRRGWQRSASASPRRRSARCWTRAHRAHHRAGREADDRGALVGDG